MSDNANRFINPEGMWRSTGYSHIVETRATRTLYLSGQVPVDEEGNLVAANDMAGQAEKIFENIGKMLASVGATFEDIVKVTYYVADVSQMQAIRDIRDKYFPNKDRMPASTAIGITLLRPGLLLEVEVTAALYD